MSVFPGDRRGAVEDCPHCGSYLDVPDETDEDATPVALEGEVAGPVGPGSADKPRSWGQIVQKAIIWTFVGCLFLYLCLPVIAVILSIILELCGLK